MIKTAILEGTVHHVPDDLKKVLFADKQVLNAWQTLTPLARNEWICWNITVKQQKTRNDHIRRTVQELRDGKRRPCCWMGCMHRTNKPLSPTQKWLQNKQPSSTELS